GWTSVPETSVPDPQTRQRLAATVAGGVATTVAVERRPAWRRATPPRWRPGARQPFRPGGDPPPRPLPRPQPTSNGAPPPAPRAPTPPATVAGRRHHRRLAPARQPHPPPPAHDPLHTRTEQTEQSRQQNRADRGELRRHVQAQAHRPAAQRPGL